MSADIPSTARSPAVIDRRYSCEHGNHDWEAERIEEILHGVPEIRHHMADAECRLHLFRSFEYGGNRHYPCDVHYFEHSKAGNSEFPLERDLARDPHERDQ